MIGYHGILFFTTSTNFRLLQFSIFFSFTVECYLVTVFFSLSILWEQMFVVCVVRFFWTNLHDIVNSFFSSADWGKKNQHSRWIEFSFFSPLDEGQLNHYLGYITFIWNFIIGIFWFIRIDSKSIALSMWDNILNIFGRISLI